MRVVVFDIGGTNCRAALADLWQGRVRLLAHKSLAGDEWQGLSDLVRLYCAVVEEAGQGEKEDIAAVCLALAGPTDGKKASLSNRAFVLERSEAEKAFGKPVFLVNDFEAVSMAMEPESASQGIHVYGKNPDCGKIRASAGAGTGFGCGLLLPGGVFVPSEGGHMALALVSERERELASAFGPMPEMDDLVSGRGLEALARAITGRQMSAADASALYLQDEESELFVHFARLFARACRNWALATMCRGGLWIAGGIAMKNPLFVQSRHFRTEFVKGKGELATFLEEVPVSQFLDEELGLKGAALIALRRACTQG